MRAPAVRARAESAVNADRPGAARVHRESPSPSDLRGLLEFRTLTLSPVARRLASALTIKDLRNISRRTTPRAVFVYVDGAADTEVSARRNAEAFQSARFIPEALHGVRRKSARRNSPAQSRAGLAKPNSERAFRDYP